MTDKKISEVLSDVMKNMGESSGSGHRGDIIDWDKIWAEISGDASRYSYFIKFRDGELWIAVKNSAWVLELKKKKTGFTERHAR